MRSLPEAGRACDVTDFQSIWHPVPLRKGIKAERSGDHPPSSGAIAEVAKVMIKAGTLVSKRTVTLLSIVLASIPLWVLADFYSLALRTRLSLGRWPIPFHPAPKDLFFDIHWLRLAYTLAFGVPVLVALSIASLIWLKRSGGRIAPALSMMVCTWGAALLVWYFDPGAIFRWFWD